MKTSCFNLGASLALAITAVCGAALGEDNLPVGKPNTPVEAFDLHSVKLLGGPLLNATEMDRKYLLSIGPDRLLHSFRLNAGLASSAEPLGGWEAPASELRGHFAGHFLSASAMVYASTGDAQLKKNADAVVAGLAECQAKLGDTGYLSAFPESFFAKLEARQAIWAPYYTIHKILAGLEDMYVYCGNQQALEVARKLGDWITARNSRLSDAQLQAILRIEQGGITEALANLSALTSDSKYLDVAKRFNHVSVIGPASRQEDRLTGLHINSQIPKFIGAAREYELGGDDSLKTAATFFWDMVVTQRSFVTGGMGNNEYFTSKEKLSESIGPKSEECCNAYNMLKLTRRLFCGDPKALYADYYERTLYNHILASQEAETGMLCHYLPLQAGSHKNFGPPFGWLSCCTGTGIESHAKHGDSIYFHDGTKVLFVNQFVASELDWSTNGIRIRQETKYPDEGVTKLAFTCKQPMELALEVRRPWWATTSFEILINGKRQKVESQPGTFAKIARKWSSGDALEVRMPFILRTEGFSDNPNRRAVLYGPLVLCTEVDRHKSMPMAGSAEQLLDNMKPVAGKPNTFVVPEEVIRRPGQAPGAGLSLSAFYQFPRQKEYMVYWDFPQSAPSQ